MYSVDLRSYRLGYIIIPGNKKEWVSNYLSHYSTLHPIESTLIIKGYDFYFTIVISGFYFLVFITLLTSSWAAFGEPTTANEEKELDNIDGFRNPKCKILFLNIRHREKQHKL